MARWAAIPTIGVALVGVFAAPAPADAVRNGPIAFNRFIRGEGTSIRVANPDGSYASVVVKNVALVPTSGRSIGAAPAWSPDGRRIAYAGNGLWVQNVYRGTRRRLASGIVAGTPSWSPSGKRIVFSRERKGRGGDLWTIGVGGGRPVRLTRDNRRGVFNTEPDWSPDGSRIVYSRTSSGPPTIRVVRANGSGQPSVIERAESPADPEGSPSWSPDGDRIAFTASTIDGFQIHLINPDGSGRTQLTELDRNAFDPSWSPRGDRLAIVTSGGSGSNQVRTINSDGSGAKRLPVPGFVGFPEWGAGPRLTRLLRPPR